MEKMEDISSDQANPQAQATPAITTDVTEASTTQLSVNVNVSETNIITSQELSASISSTAVTVVSTPEEGGNMIDSGDFRAQLPEPSMAQYQTLNGRMSPGYNIASSYATLTPLQPLPPISSVTNEKFGHPGTPPNVTGGYSYMNNPGSVDMNAYMPYNKMNMGQGMGNGVGPVPMMGAVTNGYGPINHNTVSYQAYNQNGMHSPKQIDTKPVMSPNNVPYDPYRTNMPHMTMSVTPSTDRLHSPNSMIGTAPNGMYTQHPGSPIYSQYGVRDIKPPMDSQGKGQEQEEINTKELAQRISSELKRYSIPQAVFAQRVLCRSQGTLSDLLRNPKPWSKLKSGRETFRRMWKWLQEPEFQRMSALRLAGLCKLCFVILVVFTVLAR